MPFQYRPRQNRYVGSITDLMGRGRDAEAQALITAANAQAQAAQASGQAWGGAVQSIGNTIGAIPGQLQAQQDRDMALADRARVIKQRELEDADRANRERASAMFAERISPKRVEGQPVEGPNSMPPVPTQHPYQVKQDGAWLFDIEGFQRAAAEAGPGVLEQVGPYINQMSSMNQWRQGVIESGKQEAQRQAVFLSLLDDDDLLRVLPVAMRGLEGVFDEAVTDGLMGLVRNGDAVGVRKVLNGFTGRQSDRVTVKPGETIRDLSTGEEIEGGPLVAKPVGSLQEVSRNGVPVLVQPYSDGSVRDVPGLDPAIERAQTGSLVPVVGPDGSLVYGQRVEGAPVMEPTGRALTSGDVNRIAELSTSLDDLDVLDRTLFPDAIGGDMETEASTGTAAFIGSKMPTFATEWLGWGEEPKQRQAVIDRVKQVIGKALEGGVLRKEDESKYARILPTIQDDPRVAKAKLEGLRDALTLRRERLLENLQDAGYDVSGFGERGVEMVSPNGERVIVRSADIAHYESLGATRVR